MGMSELPADITQLTMLENLNISNNKLNNLRRVEQLPNLKSLNA
jgi:Leucine-rich repeat (LRR) protein